MTAEIISVGTELLLGDIVDTNAQFLSQSMAELGINVYRRVTVGDNAERLLRAFDDAFACADIVVASGGLGPTADDITRETAAEYFGLELMVDSGLLEGLKQYFQARGQDMPASNIRQARVPAGALVLGNANGTAPGLIMEKDGKTIVLLPGPPDEAKPMFFGQVIPYLREKQDAAIVSKTLKMTGIGESAMEELVRDLMAAQTNPTIAPYAGAAEVRLRITARADSRAAAAALIEPTRAELYGRLSAFIYGEDDDTLESAVVRLLRERGLTVACAESCTGGMLTSRLVNVPGSSEVLGESVITYSNEAKNKRLGVPWDMLNAYGTVSPQVAMAMAEGVARASGADVGLAVTGIAGPGGGTQEKPVGLTYCGIFINGHARFKEERLRGDRNRIRTRAAARALDLLWRALRDNQGRDV